MTCFKAHAFHVELLQIAKMPALCLLGYYISFGWPEIAYAYDILATQENRAPCVKEGLQRLASLVIACRTSDCALKN